MHFVGLLLITLVVPNGEKPATQAQGIRGDHREVAGENVAGSRGQKVSNEASGGGGSSRSSNVPNSTIVAVAAVVVALSSAVMNALMWHQMREANRHARESFEVAHTPHLHPTGATVEGDFRLANLNPVPVLFTIGLENKGVGTAHDVITSMQLIQLPGGDSFTFGRIEDPTADFNRGVYSLGRDSNVVLGIELTPVADINLHQAFFGICVIFRDDFEVWHRYLIAYRYDHRANRWEVWGDRRDSAITLSPLISSLIEHRRR